MADPTPGRAGEFAGDDRVVVEYLLGEVIGGQSAPAGDFLLRTCIANRICGKLADVLIEGGLEEAAAAADTEYMQRRPRCCASGNRSSASNWPADVQQHSPCAGYWVGRDRHRT